MFITFISVSWLTFFPSFTFFLRTNVQGGRGDQLKSVHLRTGGKKGLKIADTGHTYFMDGPYLEICRSEQHKWGILLIE